MRLEGVGNRGDTVLEGNFAVGHLAGTSHLSQLPGKLRALRQSSGTERVTLGDQTTRWVDNPFAAIGHIAAIDEFARLSSRAQAESFVGDQLVRREAIMELNDLHILGGQAGLLEGVIGRIGSHIETNHLNVGVIIKGRASVGLEGHANDLNGLVLQSVLANKLLARQNGASSSLRLEKTDCE